MPVLLKAPCPAVTVTPEDPPGPEEQPPPPPRVRVRSLSGGAYRLAPAQATAQQQRMRRQSGDDVLTRNSPSRRTAIFDHFRPRSKSDSKGKRPTFLANLRSSFFSGGAHHRKTSLEQDPPLCEGGPPTDFYRQRAGSETRGQGTMAKVIDLFRSRSNSLTADTRGKNKFHSSVPNNALLRRHSVDPEKRRRPFNSYRSLEAAHHADYGCHSEDEQIDRIDYKNLGDDIVIPAFLGSRPCYSVMPTSGKVIVLSLELLVKNAFSALVTNEIRAAPLWDDWSFSFVGLLTISDFINVLRHYYYSNPEDIKDIENQTIATWRKNTKVTKPFIKANGMDSLAKATKLLIQEGVHRIPVIDERRQCVLFVLTRKRLLQYLYHSLIENFEKSNVRTPAFFSKSIKELGVGTFSDIAKVTLTTRVIEALDLFVERKVSALPIVDENDVLMDIFGKFDVFALAKEQTYHNLDMTVSDAIDKAGVHEEIYGCTADESLGSVIDKFVTTKAHRLVVRDGKHSVVGMVSLSDILKFLVVMPLVSMEESAATPSDVIDETPEGTVGSDNVFLDSEPETLKTPENPLETSKTPEDTPETSGGYPNISEEEEIKPLSEGLNSLKIEDLSTTKEEPEPAE